MTSTLPPNILLYIGTFIDKKDRLTCALVCKHWKEPFLDAYWGRLKIGKDRMDINTLIYKREFLINAHRVWAVEFYDVRLNDYERLLEFQRSLPGIRYFELIGTSRGFSITNELDWNLWQSLSHLKIHLSESEVVSLQSLFTNLSVIPCLVHLELGRCKQPPISWNNFEFLHKHLPRLEYIEHDFPFKPITRDEIENIKTVEPAQTMTRIEFHENVDTHWFFYFASKYPNLRHFSIKARYNPYFYYSIQYRDQQYQSDLQLLSTLDQFFPCLKRAAMEFADNTISLAFIFYETLGHFGTKIEHVELEYTLPSENDNVNKCIQPISESLKFLEIKLYTHEVIRLDVCPRLVTLCIDGLHRPQIEVDAILECFPALRSLSAKWVSFSLSTNTRTYTPHPLQKLTINGSYIDDDAIRYVSLRCNQLKHVTLIDIHYNETTYYYDHEGYYDNEYIEEEDDEDYDEPEKFIFDMPMSNLDTFVFTISDNWRHEIRLFPKHYMIQQMENDNHILQTTQQSPRINWYHIYCDRTNRKEKVLKWELGRRDIEFCQRYLKDFARRRKRGKWRGDIKEYWLNYKQKRFWKKDLRYGVCVFRFKSVKSHFFHLEFNDLYS